MNSTIAPLSLQDITSGFKPSRTTANVSTLWFLSLTLSFSAVLIGILCLQWVREYQRNVPRSFREGLEFRQIRFEGLIGWKVPQIISILPLMLQFSVVLFFAGLFDLLWDRNTNVAIIMSIPIFFSVSFLLITTALVAVCAEFMVDAIPSMIASSPVISQTFIGLIILPIVGNAAEHVTAVTVATKNKMDLAIGVAVGSSIQIALFVTPIVVLLGWILHTDMSLYFNLFETISLFVTAFVVNFLILDGRSNYLEGSLLISAYVIIALGAFFYPAAQDQSQVGGGA